MQEVNEQLYHNIDPSKTQELVMLNSRLNEAFSKKLNDPAVLALNDPASLTLNA